MGVLTNSSVTKEIPHLSLDGPALKFDFPEVRIGVAEYEEGPTGATVFSFAKPVKAAVDVRGGGPGTIDTDVLRLGYDESFVNAISFRADRRTAWRLLQAWPTQSEIRVRK